MSKISERERLVSAIIWAHGPVSSPQVLDHLYSDWGIESPPKGVTKTILSLVHKGHAARKLTPQGYTFVITSSGEELAGQYLMKVANESRVSA